MNNKMPNRSKQSKVKKNSPISDKVAGHVDKEKPVTVRVLNRLLNLIFNEFNHYSILFKIFLLFALGFTLDLLSETLEHSKPESLILFPTLASAVNVVGIGFIISSVVMVGFTIITPFLEKKLTDILNIKRSQSTSDQNDEDSEIFHEYFLEISTLNKKMEKEQEEIEQIKAETYQIAYETQEALSILRSKVGMN